MTKRKILISIIILLALLLGAVLFIISPIFAVEKSQTPVTLEAGKKPAFSPSDFLDGDDWCVNLSIVDDDSVDYKTVGEYPVYIYHGFKKYTQYVNVIDTTAPSLECGVKNITVKKGDRLTVNTIGMDASDNTGIDRLLFQHIIAEKVQVADDIENADYTEELFLKGREIWTAEYTFEHGGIYVLTVSAMDAYNNTSHLAVNITVEEAPVLKVPKDIYLAIGKAINYSDYITAWDFLDADYDAKDVLIDTSAVNINKAGDYQVLYTARDSYGLASQDVTNVHLYSSSDLQKLINTHKINMENHLIVGAPNVYDSGYYEENNPAFIQDAMLPAVVHIQNSINPSYGSGYIIKIDDEFVTIATNDHVILDDLVPKVYFHDGTSRSGIVVASDPREDIAFLRIPINNSGSDSSLLPEYARTLRTVHINEKYWESLENDSKISICYTCVDSEGVIWQESIGHMVHKEATRTWNQYEDINECIISMDPVPGTSGSAIFDGHGHLIAMVRGYTTYNVGSFSYIETVAVPLCEILDFYEMTFHQKLQYQ